MRTTTTLAALAALLLLAPGAARAQGCIGAAVPDGARALLLGAGTVSYDVGGGTDGTDLGVAYHANPRGPLAYAAGYDLRTLGESDSRMHVLRSELALRVPRLPLPLLTVCPRTGVVAGRLSDDASGTEYTNLTVPLALVVELPLPLSPRATLVPYAAPQYLWSRTSGTVFNLELDESQSGFGVEAGAALRFDRVVVTGGFLTSDLGPVLGTASVPQQAVFVRAGILF